VSVNKELEHVQGLMVFLASTANGLEEVLGRGAGSVTFRAGRQVGLNREVKGKEPRDLSKALDLVWDEMCEIGMRWKFEPYKKAAEDSLVTVEDGRKKLKLVFRNCMVRCALFRYGHPQRLSLCLMNHGLFCGLLENIHGKRANLDIVHAGENACLKVLTVEP
jgi:predicted hydrocarbon binding protein